MSKNKKNKRDFFWMSYSDLMTSLFFVMLVLFVLYYTQQKIHIRDLLDQKEKLVDDSLELAKIKEIRKAVEGIDKRFFVYDSLNKKHILKVQFSYPRGINDINQIIPDMRSELIQAGMEIKKLVLKFPPEDNIKYLLVIEGQASNDGWIGNDDLSFHRAQSLIKLWESKNVGLDKISNCEIVVAGSGEKGIPRIQPDKPPANQRFLITIIPKIGDMKIDR